MRKYLLIVFLLIFGLSLEAQKVFAQEEEKPTDLSVGEPKRKAAKKEPAVNPAPAPAPTETPTPPAPVPTPAPSSVPPSPAPIPVPPAATQLKIPPPTLPTPVVPVATPSTPAAPPVAAPAVVENLVPSNVSVVSVGAVETSGDLGTKKDAGSDLSTALPVTYNKYDDNSLSSQDMIDVYKFYGRSGEGVGIILLPNYPNMQLSVEILGESGELLSQTQASQPGAPLSFQTSPLQKNTTLYLRIKDTNLVVGTASPDLRKYALELKPIVAPVAVVAPPPAAAPPPPAAVSAPTATPAPAPAKEAPKAKAKSSSSLSGSTFITIGGIAVLAVVLAVMIVLRKSRQKKEADDA